MSADLLRLLDELDAAREKATPGPWEVPPGFEKVIDGGAGDHMAIIQCDHAADAACIVAAVNAVPKLTAALRAVLAAVDEWERNAPADPRISRWLVASVLRGDIAAALTPEQADR